MTAAVRSFRWHRRLLAALLSSRGRRRLLVVALASLPLCGLLWILRPYPRADLHPDLSLLIVARDGRLLRELPRRGGGHARWVPLDRIAPALLTATIAAEDRRFHSHHGVDLAATARATWQALRARRVVSGASTLTMQLARLIDPHRRDLFGKVAEAVTALRLERSFSKAEILEQYLNRVYYGNGAFGVEAAAQAYFHKSAIALTADEAALLAILPRAPRALDPTRHPVEARARQQRLIASLHARGALREEPGHAAGAIDATESPPPPVSAAVSEAPHFVDWVVSRLPPERLAAGGTVRTTLDLDLQRRLEHAVAEHLKARTNLENAGIVILDPATGAVRAMVGSADHAAPAGGQVNITTTPRHPGSALKPFIYALALERGDTPATLALDAFDEASAFHPDRPMRQHGLVRYRDALASSYNLAAVHVLERVGVGACLERLRLAGIGPLTGTARQYGPSLALGAPRVALVDLAASYGFLVGDGIAARARGREDEPVVARRLFSPEVSWLVMDMLSDPDARRSAFGAELPFDLPFRVAAKTGTSSGFADTVAIAATRETIVAAWAGDFAGGGTRGVLSMWSAAPLVRAGLLAVADGRTLTLPPTPPALVTRDVCRISGKLPGAACPTKHEYFAPGTEPQAPCDDHPLALRR